MDTFQNCDQISYLCFSSIAIYKITFTLLLLHLCPIIPLASLPSPTITPNDDIHGLLRRNGLPMGLFPRNMVKAYSLDRDFRLQVFMENPCVARYDEDNTIFFDEVVSANISYGALNAVEGLSQEELFLWFPVKKISVSDPFYGVIHFDITVAQRYMALSVFEDPPICKPQGGILKMKNEDGMKNEKAVAGR